LARFNVLVTSATAVRRSAMPREPFPTELPLAQDWACWLRISRSTPYLFLDEELADYRVHPRSGTVVMAEGGGRPAYELAQARFVRSLLDGAGAWERSALLDGLRFRAASGTLNALSALRRGRPAEAIRWARLVAEIAGAPGQRARVVALAVRERARVFRGEDPPLSLEPITVLGTVSTAAAPSASSPADYARSR